MKKIGFILILFIALFTSCNFYHRGTIDQYIDTYPSGHHLKTFAYYDGIKVFVKVDDIDIDKTKEVSELKCQRLEEAKSVINKVKAIKLSKCDD